MPQQRYCFFETLDFTIFLKSNFQSQETILRRIQNAQEEMQQASFYDHIVVNEDLIKTIEDVKKILQ